MKKTKVDTKTQAELRVLVNQQCPSVSGKSTLTYQIGHDEHNRLHLRLVENSAGGLFSKEWVSLFDLEKSLGQYIGPFTSLALRGLFRGKSNNSPAFLLAAMLKEELAVRSKASKRGYESGNFDRFKTRMQALIDAGAEPGMAAEPKGTEAKPERKPAKAKKEAQAPANDTHG